MPLEFAYLADCPEALPQLAEWFYQEWGREDQGHSPATAAARLRQRMQRGRLPLTMVALLDGQAVGSYSLKIREMHTHPQYLHWLGAVYVQEALRGQGYGSAIVRHAAAEAARLGVRELHLYTHSHEPFYAHLGWTPIERPQYEGRQVVIMRRVLAVEGAQPDP